ncbi:uncharacterized protein [Littorina saxatilis]|uniref:uncharacterized protein n=1 Tax=Littorina saxatilis TaxID=31220 RepID=UPI0038B64236
MYTIPLLCFAAAAFVAPEVVHSEDACATITANISTAPFQEGYNATLTFTISNNCTGSDTWVKTVKGFAETDASVATPMCQILFNNTVQFFASGCTYDLITHSGTITKHIDGYQDENWTLFVMLKNGNIFNTTVEVSANYESVSSSSNNLVVAVSASTVGVICFVTIAIVFYVKKVSQGVEMRNRAKDSSEIDDQCVNRLTAAEISNVMYRGSNVSLMICNDIYDGAENVITK